MFVRTVEGVYQSPLLSTLPWLVHGFGTRHSAHWPAEYTNLKQTHSDLALSADGQRGCFGRGDALIVSEPGNLVGIRTADCIPILLADPVRRVVAAVHAGWRGTVANIAGKTVRKITKELGGSAHDLIAAIGPGIGVCCFEVGMDVWEQFWDLFPERMSIGSVDRHYVDLVEANRRQLLEAGIPAEHIDVSGLCTVCSGTGEFHSYRRDRDNSGRMVSAIGIVGK